MVACVPAAGRLGAQSPSPRPTVLTPGPAPASQPAAPVELASPLPVDPAVAIGTLPNGLTYYIRRNDLPAARVSLRLVVKAGSVNEADDQRGLAHVLEHMAFNGSAHFKPGELVSYLETIGMRFGPDLNAYTSFDETVYMLEVPTDRPGLTERGFLALADIAHAMSLDPTEIDKERGVVLEEWRGRRGVGARVQDVQQKVLYHGSRYAERLPIGLPEVIRSFRPERLRTFYTQWYRPDRMAVIAVGQVEPAEVERRIREDFGVIPAPPDRAPVPVYDIPPHQETLVSVVADKEAQASTVSLVMDSPAKVTKTLGDYRRDLVEGLATGMLNARLSEIARRPDAPFLSATAEDGRLGKTVEAYTLTVRTPDGALDRGLQAVVEEARRAETFGFGQAELDRERKESLASYEQAHLERDKTENASYVQEYVDHFLDAQPIPGIAEEYRLVSRLAPTITVEDASAAIRRLVRDDNRAVLAVAPDKPGVTVPTDATLRSALQSAATASLTPWMDDVAGKSLLAAKPTPGRVVARRQVDDLGVTVLTLSNGMEVWLKPTDFKNDEVLLSAYAFGGTSLAPPSDYYDASLASSLVSASGVGGFTPVDLGKLLAGTIAGASPGISLSTATVSGGAAPRDLETALQLLYLDFTAPNDSPDGMALLTRRLDAMLANQARSPGSVFAEKVREVNMSGHYSSRAIKPADVAKLRRDVMLRYYRDRFANAADFTAFIVGSIDMRTAVPLVEQYLGALPSTGKRTALVRQLDIAFPAGIQRVEVDKGQEPKSQTIVTFFADTKNDEYEGHRARGAAAILEVRLRDLLREELGQTYGVGVDTGNLQPQRGYGTISVSFGSAPENQEKLTAAVLETVKTFREQGPTPEEVRKQQEQERRALQTAARENAYWLQSMQTVHILGWDPRSVAHRLERTDTLTAENIHAAAQKYLPLDRYTVLTLKPEAQGQGNEEGRRVEGMNQVEGGREKDEP